MIDKIPESGKEAPLSSCDFQLVKLFIKFAKNYNNYDNNVTPLF